jgi:hypothetical protein
MPSTARRTPWKALLALSAALAAAACTSSNVDAVTSGSDAGSGSGGAGGGSGGEGGGTGGGTTPDAGPTGGAPVADVGPTGGTAPNPDGAVSPVPDQGAGGAGGAPPDVGPVGGEEPPADAGPVGGAPALDALPQGGAVPVPDAGPPVPDAAPPAPDAAAACEPGAGEPDRDDDGIVDRCDNCPDAANNNQRDTDGDGVGDVCDVPPECAPGSTEMRACGLGGTGIQMRVCEGERWSAFGPCEGEAECLAGDTETEPCPGGERTRTCIDGAWSPFGACVAAPECRDGTQELRACGVNGRGQQVRTCVQGAWGAFGMCVDPDRCLDAAVEVQACGLNDTGTRTRTCVAGQWSPYGECVGADVCVDGSMERRACDGGEQTRTCIEGQWGAWGQCIVQAVCQPGAQEFRACGLNGRGTQRRTCGNTSLWQPWGACNDPDVCTDGTRRMAPCDTGGEREETCVQGQWAASGVCPEFFDACAVPSPAVVVGDAPVEVVVDNTGYQAIYGATCASGALGAEVALPVRLLADGLYVFEAFGDRDAVFTLRSVCGDDASEVACDDDSGESYNPRIESHLPAGQYTLMVDSFRRNDYGPVTVRISRSAGDCIDGETQTAVCAGGEQTRLCVGGTWAPYGPCLPARCIPENEALCRLCTDDLEVNDQPVDAAFIDTGVPYETMTLCGARDPHDYYTFSIDAPSLVVATSTSLVPNQQGLTMTFEDWFAPIDGIDSSGPSADVRQRISFLETPGEYLAHLELSSQVNRFDYRFQVDVTPSPACEHIGNFPGCIRCVDAYDPNDERAAARLVNLDAEVQNLAVCSGVDQRDFFAFNLPARRDIYVYITPDRSYGRFDVNLYDAAGNRLQTSIGGNGVWVRYGATLNAGLTYIEVSALGVVPYSLVVRGQ